MMAVIILFLIFLNLYVYCSAYPVNGDAFVNSVNDNLCFFMSIFIVIVLFLNELFLMFMNSFRGAKILGAGMIKSKIRNLGTGGKSKCPKTPQADPSLLEKLGGIDRVRSVADSLSSNNLTTDESHGPKTRAGDEWQSQWGSFIVSDHPKCETLGGFLEDVNDPIFFEYDCHGAPFCGYVAIDVSVKSVEELKIYRSLLRNPNDNPIAIGSPELLNQWANKRGLNLVIWRFVDGHYRRVYNNCNSPVAKTVHLCHQGPIDSGHYVLLCRRLSSENGRLKMMDLSSFDSVNNERSFSSLFMFWFLMSILMMVVSNLIHDSAGFFWTPIFSFVACFVVDWFGFLRDSVMDSFVVLRTFRSCSDHDRRCATDRRDALRMQDSYAEVEYVNRRRSFFYWCLGSACFCISVVGCFVVPCHKGLLWFSCSSIVIFVGYYCRTFIVNDVVHRQIYLVSVQRFLCAYNEACSLASKGLDVNHARSTIFVLKDVNTDSTNASVLNDTVKLIDLISSKITVARLSVDYSGMYAYNADGGDPYFDNHGGVLLNQMEGVRGGCVNHVSNYRLEQAKINKPVLVAPLGPVIHSTGPVSPGLFNINDSPTLLAAFAGRSMKFVESNEFDFDRFMTFAFNFLQTIIERTDMSGLVEPNQLDYFKQHYRGKKTQKYINRVADNYVNYVSGANIRGFDTHGAFVKFEDNSKIDGDGEVRSKPRLIMTMSDLMLVECCPIMEIIHRWNSGPFSQYQIKDITPEQIVAKITQNSSSPHMVTDYSSFEASVNHNIRGLENFVLKKLCLKAGFDRTWRNVVKYNTEMRHLKTKFGRFCIQSRCSGDFWTSFGNGVVNVCLMAYCAHLKGVDFDMVAEGDDGLVKQNIPDVATINKLGFKFSQSVTGNKPGDCDFLRSRWMNGERYLNIGRCLNLLWIKKACFLKRSKQLYLLRASANSLHHLSPGHPVLGALVEYILDNTKGYNSFSGSTKYLDYYHRDITEIKTKVAIKEHMREAIARGAVGFPPIPISVQLELERRFSLGDFYIGHLLDDYEEIQIRVKSSKCLSLVQLCDSKIIQVARCLNSAVPGSNIVRVTYPYAS